MTNRIMTAERHFGMQPWAGRESVKILLGREDVNPDRQDYRGQTPSDILRGADMG